jgi:hypothetical protein
VTHPELAIAPVTAAATSATAAFTDPITTGTTIATLNPDISASPFYFGASLYKAH